MCPSGALAGECMRNRRLVSANGTCNRGLGASKGIGSPGRAGLGPTKRPGPTCIKLKNGAYNISPTTKIFRPRKIRLTRKDAYRNSSSPPLGPK